MQHVDIAIVGGGIVGLTLAAALKDSELNIAIIDKSPCYQVLADRPTARVSAINQANIKALQQFDVWPHLQQDRANSYTAMHVWDKDSFGDIHFSCDEMGSDTLGVIVENQALVNALAQAVEAQSNVQLVTAGIDRVLAGPNQTMLMLDNDDVLSCRLLVGADGANSFVRKQAGLPITFKDYEHTAIVANVKTDEPHNNVARQAFTPTGPLALLPMAEPNVCSIVWSQTPEQASSLMALDDDAFCHALTAASNSVLGTISLETERAAFPLTMRYARQWAKDGVVLVGDAAHTIHPLAGQGVNLGLMDAAVLAEEVVAAWHRGAPWGSLATLSRYERRRRLDNTAMLGLMKGFKVLFGSHQPVFTLARNLGMSGMNQLVPLKRVVMRQATGERGRLPLSCR